MWFRQVILVGIVSVKLNELVGPYIKSFKWVRQGDPLSPILFNMVADGLTRMIEINLINFCVILWIISL